MTIIQSTLIPQKNVIVKNNHIKFCFNGKEIFKLYKQAIPEFLLSIIKTFNSDVLLNSIDEYYTSADISASDTHDKFDNIIKLMTPAFPEKTIDYFINSIFIQDVTAICIEELLTNYAEKNNQIYIPENIKEDVKHKYFARLSPIGNKYPTDMFQMFGVYTSPTISPENASNILKLNYHKNIVPYYNGDLLFELSPHHEKPLSNLIHILDETNILLHNATNACTKAEHHNKYISFLNEQHMALHFLSINHDIFDLNQEKYSFETYEDFIFLCVHSLFTGSHRIRQCEQCKKLFLSKRTSAIFCSPKCKNKYDYISRNSYHAAFKTNEH